MIHSNVAHLQEFAEAHGRSQAHALLRYVNTNVAKPTKTYPIQELIDRPGIVKVLPGLAQLLPILRNAPAHRHGVCKIDQHELTEAAHEARFIMELAQDHELKLWVLIYLVSQQLHGEEGFLSTDNKTTILFGTDGVIYSARYWSKVWHLNALSLHDRRRMRWPKGTLILSLNEDHNLH